MSEGTYSWQDVITGMDIRREFYEKQQQRKDIEEQIEDEAFWSEGREDY